ncbi:type I-E CRISPR-associated protein Cse2/CasB [Streptomyces yokosukanensis]|uniref:Type I-E CRISPR-associated protein Cse2/CasB n=1 Tax=Streptomyces yokosukanensis TaxID=67386 RepID=A0A101NWZ9_9ACTN|nr:type I-E CRISPR-associated protein Cse2/CasB [Streptomyces yokosukanensis]KUN00766.1 type I-E CRISPR-associated protein Cse2/CasB [Streptomyces yokosukanensis]
MPPETDTNDSATGRRRRLVAYTRWIEELCREDPGARTALRSGLRRGLDDVPRMHRFVSPWLPQDRRAPDSEERAYYAVAAMIAAQSRSPLTAPESGQQDQAPSAGDAAPTMGYGTSLGLAFALAVTESPGREREMRESTAESRLNLLTRQSINGLHRHLPAAVGYLRDVDVPVDWPQLLADLIAWPTHSGRISRRWLQDYYRQRTQTLREQADQADQDKVENPAPVT